MAYNAVVHARGAAYARENLAFLKELVLDLERVAYRAALIDYEGLKAVLLRPPGRVPSSSYKLHGGDLVDVVELHIGALTVFVSARPSTAPLRKFAAANPTLFVYSEIDEEPSNYAATGGCGTT